MSQGKKYPWKKIAAELRLRPGQWRLFPEMTGVPVTLVNRIRSRDARGLRFPDGKIYARRSIHLAHKDDAVITDVWLCWRPTTKENPDV